MRRLVPAALDARRVFIACAVRTDDGALKRRLLASADSIEIIAQEYDQLGANSSLGSFSQSPVYPFAAAGGELGGLYNRVLRDGGERKTYDIIMQSAPRGVCPQCGVGRVRTLDHYLPKTRFPELAVVPRNLVPTCRDCNFDKREHYDQDDRSYLFHPYYDNWDGYRLVIAAVSSSPRISLEYSIAAPQNAPPLIVDRARSHFSVLNLGELYAMNAGSALGEVKINCARAASGGALAVREYLSIQEAAAARVEPNGWRAAMYGAMAADEEFYSGAYLSI